MKSLGKAIRLYDRVPLCAEAALADRSSAFHAKHHSRRGRLPLLPSPESSIAPGLLAGSSAQLPRQQREKNRIPPLHLERLELIADSAGPDPGPPEHSACSEGRLPTRGGQAIAPAASSRCGRSRVWLAAARPTQRPSRARRRRTGTGRGRALLTRKRGHRHPCMAGAGPAASAASRGLGMPDRPPPRRPPATPARGSGRRGARSHAGAFPCLTGCRFPLERAFSSSWPSGSQAGPLPAIRRDPESMAGGAAVRRANGHRTPEGGIDNPISFIEPQIRPLLAAGATPFARFALPNHLGTAR